jgi:hypothetical protein
VRFGLWSSTKKVLLFFRFATSKSAVSELSLPRLTAMELERPSTTAQGSRRNAINVVNFMAESVKK